MTDKEEREAILVLLRKLQAAAKTKQVGAEFYEELGFAGAERAIKVAADAIQRGEHHKG